MAAVLRCNDHICRLFLNNHIISAARSLTVQSDLAFQESLKEELYNKNAAISGVNMDEELSNMIIFEQAYLHQPDHNGHSRHV